MVNNKKIITLLMCIGLTSSLHAQQPAKPSIAMGLLKDIAWFFSGIGKGASYAGKNIYSTWVQYGHKNIVWTALAGVGGYAIYLYHSYIKPLELKYSKDSKKFCVIGLIDFPNHVSIEDNKVEFLKILQPIEQKFEKEYGPGSDISKAIDIESKELKEDIAKLENSFIKFFAFLEPGVLIHNLQPNSIINHYENICKNYNQAAKSWTQREFKEIDQAMIQKTKYCLQSLLRPFAGNLNYENAAALWWKLQKLEMRLHSIKKLLHLAKVTTNVRADMRSVDVEAHIRRH